MGSKIETDHFKRGKALLNKGRYAEVKTLAGQLALNNPESSQAHVLLGWVHYRQNNLQEAYTQFREAVRIHPESSESHAGLALVYAKSGQNDLANYCIEKAKAFDSGTGVGLWNEAFLHANAKRYRLAQESAIEGWRKTKSLDFVFLNIWILRCRMRYICIACYFVSLIGAFYFAKSYLGLLFISIFLLQGTIQTITDFYLERRVLLNLIIAAGYLFLLWIFIAFRDR